MGLASRGCLVLVLGATAERRKLLFRSDLGLPWIRTLGLPLTQVKQQQNEMGRAFNGHLADHHQFCSRPRWAGSTASTPLSPDIDEQIEARRVPFRWKAILGARVLIAEDLGAARHPWCSRGWSATPEGAQPADTPSRWRGAATSM